MLVFFMIASLIFMTFTIEYTDISGRAGVDLTLLLTLIAQKFTLAGDVPKIAYLTFLDKYIFSCLMLVVVASVENMVMRILEELEVEVKHLE